MTRALLLTHWVGTGATLATARRPRLPQVFTLSRWEDRGETASPAVLSMAVIEAEATEAVLDQIEASGTFGPAHILLAGGRRPEGSIPADAEFNALRARLATMGASTAQIDDALGALVAGRTRRQIARRLLAWLRSR